MRFLTTVVKTAVTYVIYLIYAISTISILSFSHPPLLAQSVFPPPAGGGGTALTTAGTPQIMLDGWSTTVTANTCSVNTLNFTGVTINSSIIVVAPPDLGANLMFFAIVPSPDQVQIRVCNPTVGNIATGTGNGWAIKVVK